MLPVLLAPAAPRAVVLGVKEKSGPRADCPVVCRSAYEGQGLPLPAALRLRYGQDNLLRT
jgi:hypothetical protein